MGSHTQEEIDLIIEGDALAVQLREYIAKLEKSEVTDKRSVALAKTNLQQGLMWSRRGIVKPDKF